MSDQSVADGDHSTVMATEEGGGGEHEADSATAVADENMEATGTEEDHSTGTGEGDSHAADTAEGDEGGTEGGTGEQVESEPQEEAPDQQEEDDAEDNIKIKKKKKSSSSEGDEKKKKKKRKAKNSSKRDVAFAKGLIDDEVEVSSDEEVSGDEDDDEEEDGNLKDLIAPEEDDDDIDEDLRIRRKKGKNKRKKRRVEALVEDDYELMKENLGLKEISINIDEDVIGSSESDEENKSRKRLKKNKKEVAPIILPPVEKQKQVDDDTLDNFIVDEDDDEFKKFQGVGGDNDVGGSRSAHSAPFIVDDNGDETQEGRDLMADEYGEDSEAGKKARLRQLFGSVAQFFSTQKKGRSMYEEEDQSEFLQTQLKPDEEKKKRLAAQWSHLQEQADKVRSTDIPERLQARVRRAQALYGLPPSSSSSAPSDQILQVIDQEAQWMYDQFFQKKNPCVIPLIKQVLHYIRIDYFEVPYIAQYRKDYYAHPPPDAPTSATDHGNNESYRLTVDDLWLIDSYDEKWDVMAERRLKLSKLIDRVIPQDQALASITTTDFASPTDLDDVQDFISFYIVEQAAQRRAQASATRITRQPTQEPAREIDTDEKHDGDQSSSSSVTDIPTASQIAPFSQDISLTQIMEPSQQFDSGTSSSSTTSSSSVLSTGDRIQQALSKSLPKKRELALMRTLVSWGLLSLVRKIGLTPRELGECMKMGYRKHEPKDTTFNLEAEAAPFISNKLKDVPDVLKATTQLAALEISYDVLIRRWVRSTYLARAVISTAPTLKGVREINDSHVYAPVKRIVEKPVYRFMNPPSTQFLLIDNAEKEGFITITIKLLPEHDYHSHSFSSSSSRGSAAADPLLSELQDRYLSNNRSSDAMKWNAARLEILRECASLYLHKIGSSYIRQHLLKQAMDHVIERAEMRFDRILKSGQFLLRSDAQTKDEASSSSSSSSKSKRNRIISIALGDEDSPSSLVVLSTSGHLIECLVMQHLKIRAKAAAGQGDHSEAERIAYNKKKQDHQKLLDLCKQHKVSLIVLDASSTRAREIKDELEQKARMDYKGIINVEMIDPTVSKIYASSKRANNEFKDQSILIRQAISQGRIALDPISEVCGLWDNEDINEVLESLVDKWDNQDERAIHNALDSASLSLRHDILALNLHPLQSAVNIGQLVHALERRCIRVVNHLGVDINRIVNKPWLQGPLRFVSGLGPLKRKHLLKYVESHGHCRSRYELIDALEHEPVLTPKVYANCAGFLIVRKTSSMDSTMNPLDATRIHPDEYELADRILDDAMPEKYAIPRVDDVNKKDHSENNDEDEEASRDRKKRRKIDERRAKMLEILRRPENVHELSNLELAGEAIYLEKEGKGKKLDIMLDIVSELKEPFVDLLGYLGPMKRIPDAQLFSLLTGETYTTFRIGIKVQPKIRAIIGAGARCSLDNDVSAFIPFKYVSDDSAERMSYDERKAWLERHLQPGSTVEARIVKLDLRLNNDVKQVAELSVRESDLTDWTPQKQRDYVEMAKAHGGIPYDDTDLEQWQLYDDYLYWGDHPDDKSLLAAETAKKIGPRFLRRNIVHPLFKNCTREEAQKFLSEKRVGEIIVRPSSSGVDRLALTWKAGDKETCGEDVFWNLEIVEHNKPSASELGRRLLINSTEFEDIDEIVTRFVEPMVELSNSLIQHKKFRSGDSGMIEVMLKDEKRANPKTIPYFLSFALSSKGAYAGQFFFNLFKGERFTQMPIRVTPTGFKFAQQTYPNVEALLAAIKKSLTPSSRPSTNSYSSSSAPGSSRSNTYRSSYAQPNNYAPYGHPPPPPPPHSYVAPPVAAYSNNPPFPSSASHRPPSQYGGPPRSRWGASNPHPPPPPPPAHHGGYQQTPYGVQQQIAHMNWAPPVGQGVHPSRRM